MWEGGDGKQACTTQVCLLSLSEGTGLAWLDLGKYWIAGLTPSTPITQRMGSRIRSLGVGLCCPQLFTGMQSPVAGLLWNLSLGLEAKPFPLCVSQDLQTDWSLMRLCGAALARKSPWDGMLTQLKRKHPNARLCLREGSEGPAWASGTEMGHPYG